MHRIRKMFGGGDDSRNSSVQQGASVVDSEHVSLETLDKPSQSQDNNEFTDHVETFIRKYVRIKPEDCLGCKIVATMTVSFIVGTVASQVPKLNAKLPQKIKTATIYGQYSGLAIRKYVFFT